MKNRKIIVNLYLSISNVTETLEFQYINGFGYKIMSNTGDIDTESIR